MQAPRKHRPSGRSRSRWFGGDGWRALAAFLCLALLLAFGAYMSDWSPLTARSQPAQQARGGDNSPSTGSVVFMPLSGDQCRQRVIDNATWRITDNGTAECHAVLLPPTRTRAGQPPTGRFDAFQDAFKRR
jgi:hypothetical protein